MRTLRLARVALEAEALVFRRRARAIAVQAALGAIAAIFLIGCLALAHFTAWLWLRTKLDPIAAAGALAGGDAVLGILFGLLASRGGPDRIEREARQIRDQARAQFRQSLTMGALIGPLLQPSLRLLAALIRRRRQA